MAEQTADLTEQLDDARRRAEDLDGQIARARLDGADARELKRLRSERDAARREAEEIEDAKALAEARASRAAEAEVQRRQAEAVAKAREAAAAFKDKAAAVDEALAALEAAAVAHRLAGLDLSRALTRAGMSDGGRIGVGLPPAVRWAAWSAAPTFSKDAGVPRVPAHRRRRLAESAANLTPRIPQS